MRRATLARIVFLALTLPSVAAAQSGSLDTQTLDRLYRQGESNVPNLRVLFYQGEQLGELCMLLGVKRGPRWIRPGFLVFQRRSTVDGETEKSRLKFELGKDADREEGKLLMWQSCLQVDDAERLAEDTVAITVRQPRFGNETFVSQLPPGRDLVGLDIWRHAGGELQATERRQSLGGEG